MKKQIVIKKREIISKYLLTIWIRGYDKKKFEQSHLLRADRIEYIADKKGEYFDHHLMFYLKKELTFKLWLKNESSDKPYKDIKEALKDIGIELGDC